MNELGLWPVIGHESPVNTSWLDDGVKFVFLPNFCQFGKVDLFPSKLVQLSIKISDGMTYISVRNKYRIHLKSASFVALLLPDRRSPSYDARRILCNRDWQTPRASFSIRTSTYQGPHIYSWLTLNDVLNNEIICRTHNYEFLGEMATQSFNISIE